MKPDQERVKNLLTDTISMLCRNGLAYNDELKIEGLLGITIDNNEASTALLTAFYILSHNMAMHIFILYPDAIFLGVIKNSAFFLP